MKRRTARSRDSNESEADESSSPSVPSLRSQSESHTNPASTGPMTGPQAERRYGIEIKTGKQLRALQRMEEAYGMQVAEWAQEGIPIRAMGTPSKMEAFRERKCTPVPWNVEELNEQSVQRSTKAAADASPAGDAGVPESVRDVISSPGQSLDVPIQRAMEDRMSDSFGDVRVHAGPTAARACESINARAFTVGNHVAFNAGEYDPSSPEGQHILAHELTHVRQQTAGALSMLPKEDGEFEIDPDPALEREAEEAAQRVMEGSELGIRGLADESVHVQRSEKRGEHSGDRNTSVHCQQDVSIVSGSENLSPSEKHVVEKFLRLKDLSDEEVRTAAEIFEIDNASEVKEGLERLEWIDSNRGKIHDVLPGWNANQEDRYPDWFKDPHEPNSLVIEFTTPSDEEMTLLRAHDDESQDGYWLIPPDVAGGIDLDDVTEIEAEEHEDALALPAVPKYISKATVPPETAMRISRIKDNFGGSGTLSQIELDHLLGEDAFEVVREFDTSGSGEEDS